VAMHFHKQGGGPSHNHAQAPSTYRGKTHVTTVIPYQRSYCYLTSLVPASEKMGGAQRQRLYKTGLGSWIILLSRSYLAALEKRL
jgi:hypothetical protein